MRCFDSAALSNSSAALKKILNVTASKNGEFTTSGVSLVSVRKVFKDVNNCSGINPAWCTSYGNYTNGRGSAPVTNVSTQAAINRVVTHNKVAAIRGLAPNKGGYMNQADLLDPLCQQDFYGESTARPGAIEAKI